MNLRFWKNKSVFITGHTGFKGSWLSLWLQHLQADVFGYALQPPTNPNMFTLAKVKTGMTSVIGDVRNYKKLFDILKKYQPQIVIHMAAQPLVRQSYRDPLETFQTNVIGTANLLEAVRNIGSIKAVVNVTTDKCYENKEWPWGYRESESLGGFDPYSSSKACSELVTSCFRKSFFLGTKEKIALASARAGNVIGGGDWAQDRLIPDCIKSWMSGKNVSIRYPASIRPWQHVLEPLSGYLMLAEKLYKHGQRFSEAWNFGPDENNVRTVEEIVKKLAIAWCDRAKWSVTTGKHPHETGILRLDCSKAKTELAWKPSWNIETTLEKTVQWYKIYQDNPHNVKKATIEQINQYMRDSKCVR